MPILRPVRHYRYRHQAGGLVRSPRRRARLAAAEDTLTRRRKVLGNDHPDTLRFVTNLALDLRALGHEEQPSRRRNRSR